MDTTTMDALKTELRRIVAANDASRVARRLASLAAVERAATAPQLQELDLKSLWEQAIDLPYGVMQEQACSILSDLFNATPEHQEAQAVQEWIDAEEYRIYAESLAILAQMAA